MLLTVDLVVLLTAAFVVTGVIAVAAVLCMTRVLQRNQNQEKEVVEDLLAAVLATRMDGPAGSHQVIQSLLRRQPLVPPAGGPPSSLDKTGVTIKHS